MINYTPHTFHIPVMGLGYTIDTPVKVARYGISSAISIIEDHLIEQMREFYCNKIKMPFEPIKTTDHDHRARRITAYLDLVSSMIDDQVRKLTQQAFTGFNEIDKYFQMLSNGSQLRIIYDKMMAAKDAHIKSLYSELLKRNIKAGNADVNIMTKCDRPNSAEDGTKLPYEFSDAAAALRGFANSKLNSSVIFSAGMNPRLFSYCESFDQFYPNEDSEIPAKTIIVKVSDFRSAEIQGKFLAKKGLWISEFRIESGLNCGGHVFPTNGLLMGPILDQFKKNKEALQSELFQIVNKALTDKGRKTYTELPELRISVQGGIGTAEENNFLINHYKVNSTGWGSPFLLVPEATNVDNESLANLTNAKPADYFLSYASPLGLGFNNFRKSSAEIQRKTRIDKERPGSPCYKKFLAFNTEFTEEPICTASRKYQHLKIKQIQESTLSPEEKTRVINKTLEKDCLCEGLGSSALLVNEIKHPKKLTAVTLCPGPNLAYFSKKSTLKEMVDHIYGRTSLLNANKRPHMFIKELNMYIDHFKSISDESKLDASNQAKNSLQSFKENLICGIEYYMQLLPEYINDLKEKLELLMNCDSIEKQELAVMK